MTHIDDVRLKEIAEKIKAMHAMADPARGATQGKIDNATALIQRLLTKYNISLETVAQLTSGPKRNATEVVIDFTINHGQRRFEWEETLAHNVARGFYCKVIYYREGYNFIGAAHDARIAIQTFNQLHEIIGVMATTATRAYADDWTAKGVMDTRQLRGAYSLKTFKLSYLSGVVAGIGKKLQDTRRAQDAENAGAVTALVVNRDKLINSKIKDKWPKLGKGTASTQRHNEEAHAQGFADGKAINLHKGKLTDNS